MMKRAFLLRATAMRPRSSSQRFTSPSIRLSSRSITLLPTTTRMQLLLRHKSSSAAAAGKDGSRTTSSAETVKGSSSAMASSLWTRANQASNETLRLALVALTSLSLGVWLGQEYNPNSAHNHDHLPQGLPRTCCENNQELPQEQVELLQTLKRIVGKDQVLEAHDDQHHTATQQYCKGMRLGQGRALCIVTPESLHDVVSVVQAIVDANGVVTVQGQNTGLTGGSVPRSTGKEGYTTSDGRPIVIVSMKKLDRILSADDGRRVVCLAGVGLASLQQYLKERAAASDDESSQYTISHSTLGSTFLNPTVAAGVSLGSGGTQCRTGPAYTERALYLKVTTNKWKERIVTVVNDLGIKQFEDPKKRDDEEESPHTRKVMDSVPHRVDLQSRWVKDGYVGYEKDTLRSIDTTKKQPVASDVTYGERLCHEERGKALKSDKNISRFNADTRGPDYNRSEGKVIVLASVHDVFQQPRRTKTFWLSFDSLQTALDFRRQVCLDNAEDLPMSVEYMDRDAFDVIDRAGRVSAKTIQWLGPTSSMVRHMWKVKLWVEALPFDSAPLLVDKMLYMLNPLVPSILPRRVMEMGRSMDHHVAMTVGDFGNGNMDRLLERLNAFESSKGPEKVQVYECDSKPGSWRPTWEADSLTAFRFIAAPAFRTWCVGNGVQGFSVDYALPKNGGTAPKLGSSDTSTNVVQPLKRMRYSHFACNVVHEDLAYDVGVDAEAQKHALKGTVEHTCHGRLPAEHGHGTEYKAPPETLQRWKQMDPLNVLNPGVGGLPDTFQYKK